MTLQSALSAWHAFQGQQPWLMANASVELAYAPAVPVGILANRIRIGKILTPQLFESIRRSMLASCQPGLIAVIKSVSGTDARVAA